MYKLILSLVCLLPMSSLCANLCGTYSMIGYDPINTNNYKGIVVIDKQDNVYTVNWTLEDGSHKTGTGLHKGEQLSIVFQSVENPTINGVQIYKIKHDQHLEGSWVDLGDNKVGSEKLKRINSHS